jgi:hypothetical protein
MTPLRPPSNEFGDDDSTIGATRLMFPSLSLPVLAPLMFETSILFDVVDRTDGCLQVRNRRYMTRRDRRDGDGGRKRDKGPIRVHLRILIKLHGACRDFSREKLHAPS